jgi:riboflavin transporter FmnP
MQATDFKTRTNTRTLALIIIFISLAIALNVYGPKIPFPIAPFLYYQLWEIPIVVAFLAIGPKAGVTITVINSLILLAVFPGGLPTGPLYNLIAVLAMLIGIYIPYRIATHGCKIENLGSFLRQHVKLITVAATALGIIFRVVITSFVNYFALQQPYPIGFSFQPVDALAFLPVGAVFNATIAIYTIPVAIGIAIALTSRVKIQ